MKWNPSFSISGQCAEGSTPLLRGSNVWVSRLVLRSINLHYIRNICKNHDHVIHYNRTRMKKVCWDVFVFVCSGRLLDQVHLILRSAHSCWPGWASGHWTHLRAQQAHDRGWLHCHYWSDTVPTAHTYIQK